MTHRVELWRIWLPLEDEYIAYKRGSWYVSFIIRHGTINKTPACTEAYTEGALYNDFHSRLQAQNDYLAREKPSER